MDVVAERMVAGGDALGRLPDGRVVFVRGALPGERVGLAHLTANRDFARASVGEVIEPSPHRVAPPCPALARGCGGCGWQHVGAEHQLALKVAIVAEAFARTGRLAGVRVDPVAAVSPWAYRTTLRLATTGDGSVGMRAAGSHRVVTLDDCLVAHPALTALLPGLRVRGASEVTLRLGVASGERSVHASGRAAVLDGLPAGVESGPRAVVHEQVAGAWLRVSAASFFQSGPDAAELLVAAVRRACGDALEHGELLDAFGGVGLFGATLGCAAVEVVESSRPACADARVNLAAAGVHQATVTCTPFERWSARRVPLVVADPARAGLGRVGVDQVVATAADVVVLVSCDPVAAARDARLLADAGYLHAGSQVLDLFPQTHHVEVVTRFENPRRLAASY